MVGRIVGAMGTTTSFRRNSIGFKSKIDREIFIAATPGITVGVAGTTRETLK
jgi:hypothetical protein